MRARETLAKSDQVAGGVPHGTTMSMALGWSYWDSMGLIGNGLNLRIKHGDCWNSLNFQWSLKEGNDRTKWKNPGFRAIYGLGIGDTVAGWWLDDACGYFVVRVRNKDIKSSYALTKSISKKLCIPTFSRFELQGPAQFFKIGTTCWFNHPSIYQNCFLFFSGAMSNFTEKHVGIDPFNSLDAQNTLFFVGRIVEPGIRFCEIFPVI